MLDVVAAGGQPRDQAVGRWWVSARWAPYKRPGELVRSCLLVQATSRRRQDGVPCSSTLKGELGVAWGAPLSPQNWSILIPPALGTGMGGHCCGCWSFSYSRDELRGLLPEGASLLLLRVLACRWAVPPGLIFPAINTEGHLCTSSYRALGTQQQAVGLAEVEVFVIERAVHASAGTSTACAPQHGQPLPTVWQPTWGTPCPAFLLPGGVEQQPRFPKQPLDWEEDIQLYSWFLDRKAELQASHAAYIQQHPELWALLADFLQALLLHQPRDPISFAAQFFAPFPAPPPPTPMGPALSSAHTPPQMPKEQTLGM
uniref:Ciliogenesis-associated TTC17-interacting protein n=1 Tax=Calidris pygmaea TaxID=425635 RepID=A0A8C3JQ91_9CHAR